MASRSTTSAATTDRLLKAGADIHALNTVRKHLSAHQRRLARRRARRCALVHAGDLRCRGRRSQRHRVGTDCARRQHVSSDARGRAAPVRRRRRVSRRGRRADCRPASRGDVARRRNPATRALARAAHDGDRRPRDAMAGAAPRPERSATTSLRIDEPSSAKRGSRRSRTCARCSRAPPDVGRPVVHHFERRDDGARDRTRKGRPQPGVRARRAPAPLAALRTPPCARQRRHGRHRRSDRRGRRRWPIRRRSTAPLRRASAPGALSPRQRCLRVFRGARRSHSHRSDRHERRRPADYSVSLNIRMFSRDQVLALMRERVHHPAGMRELLQILKVPRDEQTLVQTARQVARLVRRSHPHSRAAVRPAREDGPLRRPAADAPGRLRLRHARASARIRRRRHLHRRPASQRGDARRSRRRPHRTHQGRRAGRRPDHPHSRARATSRSSAATTATRTGMGYVVPFDRRVLMDIFMPPGQEGGASPGEMVTVELTRWPTADARRDRPRRRSARRHRRARRRHRDHHPEVRHSRRALARRRSPKPCGSARPCRERDIRGRTDFRDVPTVTIDGEHARDFDDAITIEKLPTATTGSACTSPTCRTTCGKAARSIARPTSAAPRSISRSAPCTCSRRSWRPGCAASIRTSIGSCSRASWRSIATATSCATSSTTA